MKYLNNIFQNLCVKNNILLAAIIIIFSFILDFIMTEVILELFDIKVEKKEKFKFWIITAIFTSLSRLFIKVPYFRIVNICVLLVKLVIILKQTIEKSIVASLITSVIVIVAELFFSKSFYFMYPVKSHAEGMINPYYRLSLLIFSCVLVKLIYFIIKKFKFKFEFQDDLSSKNKNLLLLEYVMCCNLVILNSYEILLANKLVTPITIINIMVLMSYGIKSILNSRKLEESKIKIKTLKNYNKNLNIMYDDIRSFKHDFANIVQAMGGYIDTENLGGLKDMHAQLIEELKEINNAEILNPETINNPAIYNILNSKYYKARENNINMNIEVLLDLEKIEIATLDFCRILGILLDNAIEAASKCQKREIIVRFEKDYRANRNLVIIENTYQNLDVDINKIFDKEYTSKSEKKSHGLGLWRVKKILERNNNLNLYSFKGKRFVQQLEVYNEII